MKLASIEKVRALHPIPNSDRIELAEVLGYRTIVKKGEFKVGDWCVFHLPDTIVDAENPKYAFLFANNNGGRIRTVQMRGVYSQGLAMPLTLISDKYGDAATRSVLFEGHDVTDIVKISKYEKPPPVSFDLIGDFPDGLPKTDEPNLLANPDWIDLFKGDFAYITKKMDGTSATFLWDTGGKLRVFGRNNEVRDGNNPYWNIARKYDLANKPTGGRRLAIQAEIYGPGIQGNRAGEDELKMAVFNLFDFDNLKYCDVIDLKNQCEWWGIPMVRTIWSGKFDFNLSELQAMANELAYGMDKTLPAEGIVIRPLREKLTPTFKRLSAKVISEVFAAKYGE